MSDEAVIARLFPTMAPEPAGTTLATAGAAPEPAPAPAPAPAVEPEERPPLTEAELAAKLYPDPVEPPPLADVPEEVRALRDSPERRMFSAQKALAEAIPEDAFPEGPGREAGVREIREIAADLDLTPADIGTLATRARALQAEGAPDAQTQRMATIRELQRRFGPELVDRVAEARALLQRDPRAQAMVEALGLAEDFDTVVLLAERARSQINAGKLRAPSRRR